MLTVRAGKAAVKALLTPAYAKTKSVPKVENEEDAHKLLGSMIPFAFYLRVDRGEPTGTAPNSPKQLNVNAQQQFAEDSYYAWFYEGSQLMTYVGGFTMLAVMLAGVMFPLWPPIMRLGVWYISILVLAFIGLFFVIAIVRLIFYVITIFAAPPGIWIFPKLFADVGFVSKLPLSTTCMQCSYDHRLNLSSLYGTGNSPRRRRARSPRRARKESRARPLSRTARAHKSTFVLSAQTQAARAQRADRHASRMSQRTRNPFGPRQLYVYLPMSVWIL